MSEIFSPGSVAGPAGAPGAAGAAGSLANVKSLTDNLLPNVGNLFDCTRVLHGGIINSDGSVGPGGWDVSPPIYCAGATSAITDLPVRSGDINGAYIALYDANGNFLETLPSTYFGSAWGTVSGVLIGPGSPFPLPGTQTYIRFCWTEGNQGPGSPYPVNTSASFYASSSGTAAFPATYQPFGFDTIADVNVKLASAAATTQANLASGLANAVQAAINATTLNGGSRNLFDYTNVQAGVSPSSDGSLAADPGWMTSTIYCPGATSAITNIPIRWDGGALRRICTYDAVGTFLADITASWGALSTPAPNYVGPSIALPLSGAQTFVKFVWAPTARFGDANWAGSPPAAVFYAGTASAPPPSSLPASNPVPVAGFIPPECKTASQLGVYSDDNDYTGQLQAFLNTASASNPIKLILDCGMIWTSGLAISANGYTTIEGTGPGSGIKIIAGTPQDGIRIGPYTSSTGDSEGAYNVTPPTRSALNIVLRDFTLDTSGAVNASANQPMTGAAAHSCYGFVCASASNVLVENVNFTQAPAYAMMATNTGFVTVRGCTFNSIGTIHDGIHVDGVCNDIHISDCYFSTGDDAIALNAPEGYGGDISRVTVTNCIFNGSLTVMRIYTSVTTATYPSNNVHKVRGVVVSNCSGMVRAFCFDLGITDGVNPTADYDQLVDLSVSNCSFTALQGVVNLQTPVGSVNFRDIVYFPTGTTAFLTSYASSVSRVELNGIVIRRDADANAAPGAIVAVPFGSINRLVIRDVSVVDTLGSSYSAIPCVVSAGASVGILELDGIDMTQITALLDSSLGVTNIAKIRGAGVLATGASIPDATMDNNVLYLSSNASGAPSIKVGGTAKRLTLA